jgi:hypothetical protein
MGGAGDGYFLGGRVALLVWGVVQIGRSVSYFLSYDSGICGIHIWGKVKKMWKLLRRNRIMILNRSVVALPFHACDLFDSNSYFKALSSCWLTKNESMWKNKWLIWPQKSVMSLRQKEKNRETFLESNLSSKNFYVLLPYIIYVMQSRRFSQSPAFLSQTAKERDEKYSVKSPERYIYFLSRFFEIREKYCQQSFFLS